MITVGINKSFNQIEQTIQMFVMLLLSGTFAYTFNAIGMILEEINMNSNSLKLKLEI